MITANGSAPREHAADYLAAGLSVVPIRGDGTKRPTVVWKRFQTTPPTLAEVNQLWLADNIGVGIIHGKVSGSTEAIDIDNDDLFRPFVVEVERLAPELIEKVTIIRSPRPGRHVVYKCDSIEGSQVLAERPDPTPENPNNRKTLIETRGEGGYTVAPGSPGCCHETGGVYEHMDGPPLTELPTITTAERDILFRVARSFNEIVEETPTPTTASKPQGERYEGLTPGDDYNQRATFEEILEPHGWTHSHDKFWRRPGKTNGWSATVGCKSQGGTDLFCCFSSNAHPLTGASGGKPCTTYSKFALYTALNHGGDYSAAARRLRTVGYGDQPRERVHDGGDGYTNESPKKEERKPSPSFAGVDASELAKHVDEEVDWTVANVFSADQTTLFGARSKATKTTQLADLGVAFGTGTDWLGAFAVPRTRRTLFITGEANNRAISRRLERACRVRGKTLSDLRGMLRVEAMDFPQLPSAADRAAVARTVEKFGIEVVIVDPLYRGLAGLDSARVTEIGGAIVEFAQACRPASLILSHHCIKSAAREYGKTPELEDMTGAGVAECCGNWWLIGRNAPYEFDGMHDLCVTFGGRDEQAGSRRILFNEREWTFETEPLHQYRESAADVAAAEKQRAKDNAEQRQLDVAEAKIRAALANEKTPRSKTVIRDSCGATRKWFEQAFASLLRDGVIVTRPYRDSLSRVQPEGYLLREHAEDYQIEPHSEGSRTVPDGPGRPASS
jgi:hypothetical protein